MIGANISTKPENVIYTPDIHFSTDLGLYILFSLSSYSYYKINSGIEGIFMKAIPIPTPPVPKRIMI